MRSYEVIVQPRAEREIKETHDFLATTAPASAERWLNGISKAILSLEDMPERRTSRDHPARLADGPKTAAVRMAIHSFSREWR